MRKCSIDSTSKKPQITASKDTLEFILQYAASVQTLKTKKKKKHVLYFN
jgi:hypothetical protein